MSFSKPSVLFVCHANICRSPTAEAVFRAKAKAANLDVHIDSAGTNQRKAGIAPDQRSQKVAIERGYDFTGISSRRVSEQDAENFDYIVPMDMKNVDNLKKVIDESLHYKIQLFMSFAEEKIRSRAIEVPDPYYGARQGFAVVLNLIEYASEGLVRHIQDNA